MPLPRPRRPQRERCGASRLAWFRDAVERFEGTVGVGEEGQTREVARHQDSLAELAEARLGPLAAGERQRELRVAAPGCGRQREPAAEAGVDVRDVVHAVALPEALDVRGPDEVERLRDAAAELDQRPVLDRLTLDRLAPLRLDHRARDRVEAAAVPVAED